MELPLFPLHVVLFPGRPLPLHIFEDRYRVMLSDCLDSDRLFGVVAIRSGQEASGCAETFDVGTVARIENVKELTDGRCDIVTRGAQRFRIREFLNGTPYAAARVELLEDPPVADLDRRRAQRVRRLLIPYLSCLGAPDELLQCVPCEPEPLAYLAAAALQVDLPRQQQLLELGSTGERLDATFQLLRQETGLIRHLGSVASLRPPGPGGAQLN